MKINPIATSAQKKLVGKQRLAFIHWLCLSLKTGTAHFKCALSIRLAFRFLPTSVSIIQQSFFKKTYVRDCKQKGAHLKNTFAHLLNGRHKFSCPNLKCLKDWNRKQSNDL